MPKYLAQIENGEVTEVIVCESIAWAETNLGGTWIETKIDGSERARYAGIGYVYRPELDAFLPPQPAWNYHVDGVTKNWVFPEGDHIYVPVDPRLIEQLSRGLYALIDPDRPGLYAGIIWHPTNQAWPVLQLRGEDVVPISLAANPQPLIDVLTVFVDNQGLTQAEFDKLLGDVQSGAGQVVRIAEVIPDGWQPYIRTREEAAALGYFGGEPDQEALAQFAAGVAAMGTRE
jgi:hypothetical protein